MFWRRRRPLADLSEEIRSHLELERNDLREEGISDREAPYAARRAFGNITALKERYYERSRWSWWDHLSQDLAFGVRMLFRSKVYTAAAIVTLALGIGSSVATFSVVRSVLLKPLPYPDSERIVVLEPFYKNTGNTGTTVSAPDFHDWRKQNRVFEYLAYHVGGDTPVIVNGAAGYVPVRRVTPDFFAVFGISPAAGRFWSESEDRTPVAVISQEWSVQHFGDIQKSLTRTITVGGQAMTVVGIAPARFRYPGESDIWLPAGLGRENTNRTGHNYLAVGRLRAGIDLAAAQREMRAIGDALGQQYPENRLKTVAVTQLQEKLTATAKTTLWVALAAVLAVLLIACANVANLQLARATLRTQEMAVRSALGASRGRILRQVLTESGLLSCVALLAGFGFAMFLLQMLVAMAPADIPRLDEVSVDAWMLAFAMALAVLCSMLFGLTSARHSSNPDVVSGLRQDSTRGSIGSRSRMRPALVVAEVALSVVLLAGAGLLLRSFLMLNGVDLGFSTDRILITRVSIPATGEAAARSATEFERDLIEAIKALPGVRRVAGVRTVPFAGGRSTGSYSIEGGPISRQGEEPGAQLQIVTPQFFETMGMTVRHGRDFLDSNVWGRPQVAIINETLARRTFGRGNPLGRRIQCGMDPQSVQGMEIVGVVSDTRQLAPGEPPQAEIFMPYLQHPLPATGLSIMVQTDLQPYALSSAIRELSRRMKPDMPVRFSTMSERLSESLAYPRFRAILIGGFALLAGCLAVVGIYGVVSYIVGQRANEIGLRIALGAQPIDVFRMVVGGSMRLVLWGLLLGLIGTAALSGILQTLLFGVGPRDPVTLITVLVGIALAALAGSSIPALRAARVNPLTALRQS